MVEHGNYLLRWESHNKKLSNGLTKMHESQEFIDVTLAAGDHLVGAHKNILALASPYLREMLKSVPCRHPVIFLGPINHVVLSFLLEYMYMGEVKIPSHILPSFIEASKMLHIEGVKDFEFHQNLLNSNTCREAKINSSVKRTKEVISDNSQVHMQQSYKEMQPDEEMLVVNSDDQSKNEISDEINNEIGSSCIDASIQIDNEYHNSVGLSTNGIENVKNFTKLINKNDLSMNSHYSIQKGTELIGEHFGFTQKDTGQTMTEINNEQLEILEQTNDIDTQDICVQNTPEKNVFEVDVCTGSGRLTIRNLPNSSGNNESKCVDGNNISGEIKTALYIKSTRGRLQMILNRFIYNLHHTSNNNTKRRWRCIEYRQKRCLAYVDTYGELIQNRKGMHTHSFHDSKIMTLGRKQDCYTTIERASEMFFTKGK